MMVNGKAETNDPATPAVPAFDAAGLRLSRRPWWVFDPIAERMIHANPEALRLWASASIEHFLARDFASTSDVVRERTRAIIPRLAAGGSLRERTTLYPGGPTASCDLLISGVRLAVEGVERVVMLIEASPLEASPDEARAFEALRHSSSPVALYDAGRRTLFRNPAADRVYSHAPDGFVASFALASDAERFWSAAWGAGQPHRTVAKMATLAGERWHDLVARATRDPATGEPCLLVEERDISDEVQARERAEYLAGHDVLTALANRSGFQAALARAHGRWQSQAQPYAVVCIDLDHFKAVNDAFGHSAGDALLQAAAARMKACVRTGDIIARLGGDEFAVLTVGADAEATAAVIAQRIVTAIADVFRIGGHDVRIGASAGIARARDAGDAEAVIGLADRALYRAKAAGRGKVDA